MGDRGRAALFGAMMLGCAFASPVQAECGVGTILFENDVFYNTDRDYTNGAQLAWTTAPLAQSAWETDVAHMFPHANDQTELRESFALGQDIFTPSDITLVNPPLDDHPYAGYLYGALGLIAKTPGDDPDVAWLDQLQLQLGVIGPASLAKETQSFVHRIIHDNQPEGWATQLKNEPGAVLTYEHTWRYKTPLAAGFGFDFFPHVGGAVGNVYDYLNAGAMMRFGEALPDDFGPVRVDPGLPGSNFFEPNEFPVGWYVFAGVDGRAVARDIFLDGNTWAASRHVEKDNFVGDFQFGAAVTLWGTRLTYTHVIRSREFKTQHGSDQFGAVSLSVRF